jgi:hypothetical protein
MDGDELHQMSCTSIRIRIRNRTAAVAAAAYHHSRHHQYLYPMARIHHLLPRIHCTPIWLHAIAFNVGVLFFKKHTHPTKSSTGAGEVTKCCDAPLSLLPYFGAGVIVMGIEIPLQLELVGPEGTTLLNYCFCCNKHLV